MAESRDATPVSEEAGPATRALRAAAARVATTQTWRDYSTHTGSCTDCRTGINCDQAATLRQAWLDARTP